MLHAFWKMAWVQRLDAWLLFHVAAARGDAATIAARVVHSQCWDYASERRSEWACVLPVQKWNTAALAEISSWRHCLQALEKRACLPLLCACAPAVSCHTSCWCRVVWSASLSHSWQIERSVWTDVHTFSLVLLHSSRVVCWMRAKQESAGLDVWQSRIWLTLNGVSCQCFTNNVVWWPLDNSSNSHQIPWWQMWLETCLMAQSGWMFGDRVAACKLLKRLCMTYLGLSLVHVSKKWLVHVGARKYPAEFDITCMFHPVRIRGLYQMHIQKHLTCLISIQFGGLIQWLT